MGVVDLEGEFKEDVLVAEGGFLEAGEAGVGVSLVARGNGLNGWEGGTYLSMVNLFSL